MIIAFTGHRPNKLGNDYDLKSKLVKTIALEIVNHIENIRKILLYKNSTVKPKIEFIVGMALGIDTLCAKIAIDLDIPFIAAIPFKGQSLRWPIESQIIYGELLKKADRIYNVELDRYCTFEQYLLTPFTSMDKSKAAKAMDKRNKWMVDNASTIIAVWDGSIGGTSNCYKYASSKGKEIIRINPSLVMFN